MFRALSDNYQQVFVAALTIKMCVYFIIIANVCISNAIGNKKSNRQSDYYYYNNK